MMNFKEFYEYIVPEDRQTSFTKKWNKRWFSKVVRQFKGKYSISYTQYADIVISGDINGYEVSFHCSKLSPDARYTKLPSFIAPSKVESGEGKRLGVYAKYPKGKWLYIKQKGSQQIKAIPAPKHTIALLHSYRDLEIIEKSQREAIHRLRNVDKKAFKDLSNMFRPTALYLCLKDIGLGIKRGHIIDMSSSYISPPHFSIEEHIYGRGYPFRYYTVDLNKFIPAPKEQRCKKSGYSCPYSCYTGCEVKATNRLDKQDYKKLLKLQELI